MWHYSSWYNIKYVLDYSFEVESLQAHNQLKLLLFLSIKHTFMSPDFLVFPILHSRTKV